MNEFGFFAITESAVQCRCIKIRWLCFWVWS